MLTINDLKKLGKYFATKQDLKKLESNLLGELNGKFNQVLTKIDKVFKELKDFREEQTIHISKHRQIDEDLNNHEKRLKKLEVKPAN